MATITNIMFIVVLVMLISVIVLSILLLNTLRLITEELSFKRKLDENKFNLSMTPTNEDFMILDNMITDEISLFALRETELKGNTELYMSEEKQKQANKDILNSVFKKISPYYMARLSYMYNEEVLEDIIYEKVQSAVISFSVEVNSTFIE